MLADTFVLIHILRTERFRKRVPELFENDDQLLGTNAFLTRFLSDSLEKIRELRRGAAWMFQLLRER